MDLTQQEFADRIGVKRNTVATYELGRNKPVDAVASLICREFRVNEEWLRNGTGEMFQSRPYDELDMLLGKYNLPEVFRALIVRFLELKPEQQEAVVEYMYDVATDLTFAADLMVAADLAAEDSATNVPVVPPGYSSREELEAEADEFAAMAREQFLSEKRRESQASSAKDSGGGVA